MTSECRVQLDDYETKLLDKDGNQIYCDERIIIIQIGVLII